MKIKKVNGKINITEQELYLLYVWCRVFNAKQFQYEYDDSNMREVLGSIECFTVLYDPWKEDAVCVLSDDYKGIQDYMSYGYTNVVFTFALAIKYIEDADSLTIEEFAEYVEFPNDIYRKINFPIVCNVHDDVVCNGKYPYEFKSVNDLECMIVDLGEPSAGKVLTPKFVNWCLRLFFKKFKHLISTTVSERDCNVPILAVYSTESLDKILICPAKCSDAQKSKILAGFRECIFLNPEYNLTEKITKKEIEECFHLYQHFMIGRKNLFTPYEKDYEVVSLSEDYERISEIKGYKILKYKVENDLENITSYDVLKMIKSSLEYNHKDINFIKKTGLSFALYVNKDVTEMCVIPNFCQEETFYYNGDKMSGEDWLELINYSLRAEDGWYYVDYHNRYPALLFEDRPINTNLLSFVGLTRLYVEHSPFKDFGIWKRMERFGALDLESVLEGRDYYYRNLEEHLKPQLKQVQQNKQIKESNSFK